MNVEQFIVVNTKNPIAVNSPDHLHPHGTMLDNHSSFDLILELEEYVKNQSGSNFFNFLDLGCSGGQLAVDFYNKGHVSVGLEGSDYSIIHGRANWPEYHNKVLFTCDLTKPYLITNDRFEPIKFDVLSAWELIEHIAPDDLDGFFDYITRHMHDNSIFVASIAMHTSFIGGVDLHQSIFSEKEWKNDILNKWFLVNDFGSLFNHPLRGGPNRDHFQLVLRKK